MIADATSENCCCRIRCNVGCTAASRACSLEPLCRYIHRVGGWSTLKAAPNWWSEAPGVERCRRIAAANQAEINRRARVAWDKYHCNEYTTGRQLTGRRSHRLVLDVGFHSGDDTLHFLKRGHDVVAVDANPAMIHDGLTRPTLRVAHQSGQLQALSVGIVRRLDNTNQTMPFYLHRLVTEWSTFNTPTISKRNEFDTINVPVTTCADLIRRFGTPYYMKVDIEGLDHACLRSLEPGFLPQYVSTEDPLQLDHLLTLGYRSFKMVSQATARRGGRQFSGGMPEDTPGEWVGDMGIREHPFFSTTHMHVKIDAHGNRFREEHDLHARLGAQMQIKT